MRDTYGLRHAQTGAAAVGTVVLSALEAFRDNRAAEWTYGSGAVGEVTFYLLAFSRGYYLHGE